MEGFSMDFQNPFKKKFCLEKKEIMEVLCAKIQSVCRFCSKKAPDLQLDILKALERKIEENHPKTILEHIIKLENQITDLQNRIESMRTVYLDGFEVVTEEQ